VRRTTEGVGAVLALLAVLLVGLNLRGAIAAVSPVLPDIRADTGLSATAAGTLTTLPVLCFAAAAPAAAWLGRRVGLERAVLLACLLIAAGTALRPLGGPSVLLTGTLLVGVAMTVGNVLLPAVIKRDFGARAGAVTGVYTAALAAGAAVTAGLTAALATWWGWRPALAVWALLALAAAIVWWAVMPREPEAPSGASASTPASRDPSSEPGAAVAVWRSRTAWAVTLVLGLQSMAYYSVTAWLPTLLGDTTGLGRTDAGLAMSVFQVVGIAGTLVVPVAVRSGRDLRLLGVLIALAWSVTVAGLAVWPAAWLAWCLVGGVAQGAGISYAFTVLVLRAADDRAARSLSGMAQLVGYAMGACGPLAVGALYEASGGWTLPLTGLLLVTVGFAGAAASAGRRVLVRV
jgi:CP family cyanate transporter-like MFS transporter